MTQKGKEDFEKVGKELIKYAESLKDFAVSAACIGVQCEAKKSKIRELFSVIDSKRAEDPQFISDLQAKIEAIKSQPDQP